MKIKKLSLNTSVFFVLVCLVLIMGSNSIFAADMCQIIRLEPDKTAAGTRVGIRPENITIPEGTCIVWMNWFKTGKVQVSFRDNAKACMASTEASVGFEEQLVEGQACYMTRPLSTGQTASLYFKKPGVYKYTVEYMSGTGGAGDISPGEAKSAGAIEVK